MCSIICQGAWDLLKTGNSSAQLLLEPLPIRKQTTDELTLP